MPQGSLQLKISHWSKQSCSAVDKALGIRSELEPCSNTLAMTSGELLSLSGPASHLESGDSDCTFLSTPMGGVIETLLVWCFVAFH